MAGRTSGTPRRGPILLRVSRTRNIRDARNSRDLGWSGRWRWRRGRFLRRRAGRRRVPAAQRLDDALRRVRSESRQGGDRLERRVAHALKAPERPEQLPALRFTDAGDSQQLRGDGTHRPPLSLEGDGEAMRLVARLL